MTDDKVADTDHRDRGERGGTTGGGGAVRDADDMAGVTGRK